MRKIVASKFEKTRKCRLHYYRKRKLEDTSHRMEEKEGAGINPFKGSATGLNLKYISSRTDDFSQWPSLSVESSFSYVTNSDKTNKPRKVAGSPRQHEGNKSSRTLQNGVSTYQRVNGVVHSQSKTVSSTEGNVKNCVEKDKQDFNSHFLLTGKRLQLSPEFWTPDYNVLHARSSSESECQNIKSNDGHRLSPGPHTYPPSNARSSCVREFNPRHSYTSEVNARPSYDSDIFSNAHRHRLPAFCPRPLGQTWVGNAERQKSQVGGRPLDDLLTSGERQSLHTRKGGHPRRYTSSRHLKRTSSQDHIPRTRSASLPVPSKLHESRVVMEWNEKRNGGVTYVTPVLKTLSEGDLSYSHLKIEDKAASLTTQRDCAGDA